MSAKDDRGILDYDDLVAAYQESLTTVLRGFRPPVEFLETWVHDGDDVLSILNIAEAASSFGLGRVRIAIGPETLRRLDRARLEETVAGLGELELAETSDGAVLEVRFRGSSAALPIHPVYRERLAGVLGTSGHEGPLRPEAGLTLVRSGGPGPEVEALIDPQTHGIRKAAFSGASSDLERGLLEALCRAIEGKTVLEAGDHAGLSIEFGLRDRALPRPVAGIVLPENADPAFGLVLRLSRGLLEEYRRRTGFRSVENSFDAPASQGWLSLSEEEKAAAAGRSLRELCPRVGLNAEDVKLLRLDDGVKLTVAFQAGLPAAEERRILARLEDGLKAKLEGKLQVYLEERKDSNSLRRPEAPKGAAHASVG